MTNADIFDSLFKDKGGIFDLNKINNPEVKKTFIEIKNSIQSALTFLRKKYTSLPHVYVDLINHNALNGCATKYKESYYIGINFGAYLLIQDMFNKMFATKSILSNLGDSNLESEDKKTINALRTEFGPGIDYHNIDNIIFPNDKMRAFYAGGYCMLVFNFLIMHEICHILRGHVGYITSLRTGFNWLEIDNTSNKKYLSLFDIQTLEMDSDSFATNQAFILAENSMKNPDVWKPPHDKMKFLFTDYSTFCGHFSFAVYSFFRLFGFGDLRKENLAELDHPPPVVRISLVIDNIAAILLQRHLSSEERQKVYESIFKAIESADEAFSKVTYQDRTFELFKDAHINGWPYAKKIISNWNNVRPLIEPFNFGDLPPLNNE